MDKQPGYTVDIHPSGHRAEVPLNTLLTDALVQAGAILPLDCGGKGTCGRCRVQVEGSVNEPGAAEKKLLEAGQLAAGWRLACQVRVMGDVQVRISEDLEDPESNWRIDEGDLLRQLEGTPVVAAVECEVPYPSLDDPRSDVRRLAEFVETRMGRSVTADHRTAAQVSRRCRRFDWKVRAFVREREIIGVSGMGDGPLGLAVDLGSTKLAAYLIDLQTGRILASKGRLNPQIFFGADVVTRLQHAVSRPQDARRLSNLVRTALNLLAADLARSAGFDPTSICDMAVAGNSVMTHLLLELPLDALGASPFVACLDGAVSVKARELGFALAPGAAVYLPPLIGGYVGSDNVAMILGTDLDRPGACRLGLDIGTNTEVVLAVAGATPSLFVASAPSGPTFEGAHLSSGMRAMGGAVSKVRMENGLPVCDTIDGNKAAGICGSGIIDALAVLLDEGIITPMGRLDPSRPGVIKDDRSARYTLVPGTHSATGRDIAVTQSDISQVQLAKAAIMAAIQTLLACAGMEASDIGEVILAGSFGSHIRMDHARRIGLVPDLPGAAYTQSGNAAGKGIQKILFSREQRQRAEAVPHLCRYVELTRESMFKTLFARSLAFSAG